MYTKILQFLICCCAISNVSAQSDSSKIVYLIPGTGSDERLFHALDVAYETKVITYSVPEKGMDMEDYSHVLAQQIDTTRRFAIIGVSLGGMLAIEMSKYLEVEEIILIASAKTSDELPNKYRFFQKAPIYHLLGGRFYKFCTLLFQPFYEPLPEPYGLVWRDMLKSKDPTFMKRIIPCIVEWENESYNADIVTHIHGTKDRTIPVKNVQDAILIEDATHIMIMDRAAEISKLIDEILVVNN